MLAGQVMARPKSYWHQKSHSLRIKNLSMRLQPPPSPLPPNMTKRCQANSISRAADLLRFTTPCIPSNVDSPPPFLFRIRIRNSDLAFPLRREAQKGRPCPEEPKPVARGRPMFWHPPKLPSPSSDDPQPLVQSAAACNSCVFSRLCTGP